MTMATRTCPCRLTTCSELPLLDMIAQLTAKTLSSPAPPGSSSLKRTS